jgi:hypothetical protein
MNSNRRFVNFLFLPKERHVLLACYHYYNVNVKMTHGFTEYQLFPVLVLFKGIMKIARVLSHRLQKDSSVSGIHQMVVLHGARHVQLAKEGAGGFRGRDTDSVSVKMNTRPRRIQDIFGSVGGGRSLNGGFHVQVQPIINCGHEILGGGFIHQ